MKRRTFIFGGGALATLSLGATATNASLQGAVSVGGDFRVISEPVEGPFEAESFTPDPDTENTESTHTWELDVRSDEIIDRIEANYDFENTSASFDPISDTEVTVEFYDASGGQGGFQEIALVAADYSGATATFQLDEDATVDEDARITIGDTVNGNPGIVNPPSGEYTPRLFVVEDDEDKAEYTATLTTSTGDGFFEVSSLSVSPTTVEVGSDITAEFDVTNTGAGDDTRNVILSVDRGNGFVEEESKSFTLDPDETIENATISYTAQSSDKDQIDVQVAADTDTPPVAGPIDVTGGWSLDLSPGQRGGRSIHTWTAETIAFDEDIDKITIDYPAINQNDLNFDKSDPTVTINLTNNNDVGKDETISGSGSTATWDLFDGSEDTAIADGDFIEIDALRDPDSGTYEATIDLVGVDGGTVSATVQFTI